MLAAVYAEDAPESIAEKTSLLLRHHLALWDVIANCEIDGSADASVREAVPVDIVRITDRAHITRVLCNGKLAGTLYARHLQPIMGIPALVLPSTSPANAIWTLPKLTDAWRKALHLLLDQLPKHRTRPDIIDRVAMDCRQNSTATVDDIGNCINILPAADLIDRNHLRTHRPKQHQHPLRLGTPI